MSTFDYHSREEQWPQEVLRYLPSKVLRILYPLWLDRTDKDRNNEVWDKSKDESADSLWNTGLEKDHASPEVDLNWLR